MANHMKNIFTLCRRRTPLISTYLFNASQKRILSVNVQQHSNHFCERSLHTTSSNKGLDEFLDEEANWGVKEVKHGRSWEIGELRSKSNQDLHKLWYVLVKELNMLYTMEYASKQDCQLFPSPERIDKVKDSMDNVESVVTERNKAFMQLAVGETGDRPGGKVKDVFGRYAYRDFTEHQMPSELNPVNEEYKYESSPKLDNLLKLIAEQQKQKKWWNNFQEQKYVELLFRTFPDIDVDLLKEKYPDLDIDDIKKSRVAMGNFENTI